MKPFFDAAADEGRATETLDELSGLFLEGVLDDCHHVAHHLGHAVYEETGDLIEALLAGDDSCLDGYYHGAVEAAVAGMHHGDHAEHGSGEVTLSDVCDGAAEEGSDLYEVCVHGLGHGAMQALDYDLGAAMDACETQLADVEDQEECVGGTMMENTMQFMGDDEDGFLAEAPHACDDYDLNEDDVSLCYSQIGEVSMFYFGHDITRAEEVCRSIDVSDGVKDCLGGAEAELSVVDALREAAD